MDAKMSSEVYSNGLPYWDFDVDTDLGIVPFLTASQEEEQQAAIAVFLPKDSTPQLSGSEQYVDWLGFFTHEISFGELVANVQKALENCGRTDFFPSYGVNNSKLSVAVKRP